MANSDLGRILVDSRARTLYLFERDRGTRSACFGPCAKDWPPLRAAGNPTAGDGAKASLLATTTRADGQSGVTYNGHPVYRFAGDGEPGDTNGQAVNAFGGTWLVLSPTGEAITKPAATGGGRGY